MGMMRRQLLLPLFLTILLPNSLIVVIANEQERVFRVSESLPGGQHIGFVRGESGEPLEVQDKQNFFIVFPSDGNGTAERVSFPSYFITYLNSPTNKTFRQLH